MEANYNLLGSSMCFKLVQAVRLRCAEVVILSEMFQSCKVFLFVNGVSFLETESVKGESKTKQKFVKLYI